MKPRRCVPDGHHRARESTPRRRDSTPRRFREKILWTVTTLFIYLVSCQIPIYGVKTAKSERPLY